jgi:hypothetical protein
MSKLKDQIVRLIGQDAKARVAALKRMYPSAGPEEREGISAAIEFEQWMADTCASCVEKD